MAGQAGPGSRQAAIAANTKAIRVALLATGLVGQVAVMPLVPASVSVPAAVILVGVGFGSLGLPMTGGGARGERWWQWQWRHVVALGLILLAGVAAFTQLTPGDPTSEARTLTLLLLFVQIAHTLASSTRREAALGCAVVVAMLAVAGVFASDATLLPPLVLGLAGIAVTSTLLRRAAPLESADAVSAGSASAIVRSCAAPVALAVALGAFTFLALPNSSSLHGHHRLGGADPRAAGTAGHANERATSGLVSGSRLDLRARGALSTSPVLSTPADAPRYWQGAIFDQFDGMVWRAQPLAPQGAWTTTISPATQAPPGASPADLGRADDVEVRGGSSGVVFAPGVATSYAGPGRVVPDVDGSPRLVGDQLRDGDAYRVTSTSQIASDADLRAATGPDPAEPRWTALPGTIAPRVEALAGELAAGQADRFDTVEAIENYLRTNETYDLNSPEPAAGHDAVDDFVFVSHRGFCEQFATAAVVMLRSVGVPARLVTGYAFGDLNLEPGRRVFRGTDAHAWVQVYYPGIGWVDSDPTASAAAVAASTGGAPQQSIRQRVENVLHDAWRHMPGGRGGALILIATLVAAGVGLTYLGARRSWRRRRRAPFARRNGDTPALAAYLRLEEALAGDDRARAPGETLGEFAGRLGAMVVTPRDVGAAMRCVERECYARGSRRPTAADVAAAVDVFERLRAAAGSQPVARVRAGAGR